MPAFVRRLDGTFTHLRTLGLWWTASDKALGEAAKLKSLEELELPKLKKLYIGLSVDLTQASVSTLTKMKALREITSSRLDGLAEALPKCRVNKVPENIAPITLPPLTEYPLGKQQ